MNLVNTHTGFHQQYTSRSCNIINHSVHDFYYMTANCNGCCDLWRLWRSEQRARFESGTEIVQTDDRQVLPVVALSPVCVPCVCLCHELKDFRVPVCRVRTFVPNKANLSLHALVVAVYRYSVCIHHIIPGVFEFSLYISIYIYIYML